MMKKIIYNLRRSILKFVVPEFIWPKLVYLDEVPIRVRGMNYSFGVKSILVDGSYEKPERDLLTKVDLNGFVIIEMGSSIGILTQILASKVGAAGKVIGVEADQKIANQVTKDLSGHKNIEIIYGFGFPVGKVDEHITISNFDSSLGSLGGIVNYEVTNEGTQQQPADSMIFDLERIIARDNLLPDMLVIDVEGSERIIIDNNSSYPDSVRHILIELHPGLYTEEAKEQIIAKLLENGFTIKAQLSNSYLFSK